MAYTDDSVRAKLSALNETQESIVTTAQWVMFHRRHAEHTTSLWFQRLKDSGSSKRLNLIYLANDIVQQSRARKKDDFPTAFSPIIAEATAVAYRGASNEVQNKLRRVIEVWRQRQIFELPIQIAIETRVNDVDTLKTQKNKSGSIFSNPISSSLTPSVPTELTQLVTLQNTSNKAASTVTTAASTADIEYTKLTDPSATTGVSPARQSAQLGGLLKSLVAAENALTESISSRKSLLQNLEKLIETHRSTLTKDETHLEEVTSRKTAIETKKQQIEDVLLREMSSSASPNPLNGTSHTAGSHSPDPEAPEMEPLSPLEVEALTPEGSPSQTMDELDLAPADDHISAVDQAVAAARGPKREASSSSLGGAAVSAAAGAGGVKKMKFDDDDFAASMGVDAMGGLDEDVAAMLQ